MNFWVGLGKQLTLSVECNAINIGPCLNKGVCHTVALPFTVKSVLRRIKNYRNSNISPCKNIIFKKYSKRKPKSFKIL
jgi:hypothetical protein